MRSADLLMRLGTLYFKLYSSVSCIFFDVWAGLCFSFRIRKGIFLLHKTLDYFISTATAPRLNNTIYSKILQIFPNNTNRSNNNLRKITYYEEVVSDSLSKTPEEDFMFKKTAAPQISLINLSVLSPSSGSSTAGSRKA